MTPGDFWRSIPDPIPDPDWTGIGTNQIPPGPVLAALDARGVLDQPHVAAVFDSLADQLLALAMEWVLEWDDPDRDRAAEARRRWRELAAPSVIDPDWARHPEAERVAVAYCDNGPNRCDPDYRGVLLAPTLAYEVAALKVLQLIEEAETGRRGRNKAGSARPQAGA